MSVLFSRMRKMHVYRFSSHWRSMMLPCSSVSGQSQHMAFFFCTLGKGFHQQPSESQLPRLDVYQTQQIKNGTDLNQNTLNRWSSFVNLKQTGHAFSHVRRKNFTCYRKYEFVKYLLLELLFTLIILPLQLFVFPKFVSVNHLHCQQLIP